MTAELESILQGLSICWQLGFSNDVVETDLAIAYYMIVHRIPAQWHVVYLLWQIRKLLGVPWNINLIYGEQNRVADQLAKVAHGIFSCIGFFRIKNLPIHVQKAIFYARIGLPNFRSNCK